MSLTKWIIASIWLATNCFAFNMSSLGVNSYWIIPSTLVMTAFHHGCLLRHLRRNPGQAIPRRYTYTFLFLIILWLAGGAMSILIAIFATMGQHSSVYYFLELGVTVTTFLGGLSSIAEAGLIIAIWRKCARLKTNGMAGALPLGSLDNIEGTGTKF
ncbi:hypothetical protein OPQ81_007958 [Rhizoctonia solani]|nr:hypothetical protein OPQ81_007958 [Rhizoctonia solani]